MSADKQAFKPNKIELSDWLDKQILCTLATNGTDGYPNAATVAFSQTDDMDFLVITNRTSRKAANIGSNGKVAITVTNADDKYTMQLEGRARELSWDEFDAYSQKHYAKLPFSLPFKDIPGQAPFLITPDHIRFTDVNVKPWETTEVVV